MKGKSIFPRLRTSSPLLWLLPSLIILGVVSIYPFISAVVNSFRFFNYGVSTEPQGFVGLDNYARVLGDETFLRALSQTLYFAVTVTLAELILGVAIALLLRERLRGMSAARSILIMPVAIAPAVAGLTFRSMYANGTGLIAESLTRLGIEVPSAGILGSQQTAMPALMITDVWQWTPFVALIILAAMQGVPQEVIEAARIDGASPLRILRSVTLPLIKGAVVTVVLLRFIQSFNVFDIVYVETRGGPGGATSTLGMEIFLVGLNNYNIGLSSAMTIVASLIVAVFINVYFIASSRK